MGREFFASDAQSSERGNNIILKSVNMENFGYVFAENHLPLEIKSLIP